MKTILALVAALAAGATIATTAAAQPLSVKQPELDKVASLIAGEDLEVRCWVDEKDADYDPYSWGYVFLAAPVIYLDPRVCAGARAIQTGAMLPLWQLALGALVLTHEAYHLRFSLPFLRRASEAQTECRAVKRVPQTFLDLGATVPLAGTLLPWALAEHFKITSLHDPGEAPPYDYPTCRVPGFEFWPH